MTKVSNKWIYAVYKGQEFVTEGTREEICDELGIKKATFYYCRSKHWERRFKNGKNHRIIIRIDNINNE